VLGVLAAAGRVPGATPDTPVMEASAGAYDGEEILGTRGPDTLHGTELGDLVFAFGADDEIESGPGNDVVFADPEDTTAECEEIVEADDLASPATPDPPVETAPDPNGTPAPLVTGSIDVEDETWQCNGPVDVDLVRVRVGAEMDGIDAVSLGTHCTGRIGRIEVDTWSGDGIKVQNSGVVAHDLVVESGVVRCHGHTPGYHQDGIQVMGGERLRFRDLSVQCGGDGVNAGLFIAHGGSDERVPIDVVFEDGVLGPGAAQTVLLADSLRSGVRNSTICAGRYATTRVQSGALDPVDRGNDLVDAAHEDCQTP
jgi:hypothetical protein